MKSVDRDELHQLLSNMLDPNRMADYCPNGLQVEGKREICKVITGVTASKDLLDLAVERQADAILVHHGLMWKGDPQTITGFRKHRLQTALGANLNVFAYHLPLDKHPELGNNVQLGRMLGWSTREVIGSKGLIHIGELSQPQALVEIVGQVEKVLGHRCEVVGANNRDRMIKTVAWCTGGAPGYVEEAGLAGADLYLTGELSEPAVHVAAELDVSLLGAGHHATERCGVQALGQWLAEHYGLDVEFHDLFVTV
ncbi:MAG: Nif3-like dinuclear metal center hexameric protein [Limnobacter sp.]|nr:Nif3-like dinuclear metal center hexameric protein [Limnobacter sp.]